MTGVGHVGELRGSPGLTTWFLQISSLSCCVLAACGVCSPEGWTFVFGYLFVYLLM